MWRWWFWLAEGDTCRCSKLCCSGFSPPCKERNVIWRKSNIWHTMTLDRGNSNHPSLPFQKRKICRYDMTGCLLRKQRGTTIHGSLNKKKKAVFQAQSFPTQNVAPSWHQCQKLGTENQCVVQTGRLTLIQEQCSKNNKWTVSGRAEMFPKNGFNWSQGSFCCRNPRASICCMVGF